MATTLKWNGDYVMGLTDRMMMAGMDAARLEAQAIARKKAGIANTGTRVKITRRRFGGNATSRTEYTKSSKPGESPRRRTGFGQKNIVSGLDHIGGFVGYTRLARYMMFHELGIHYRKVGLQQRPTIVPTILENRARLAAVIMRAARSVRP